MGGRLLQPQPAPLRFGQVPADEGIVFVCACGRPHGVRRDKALKAWGEQGRIQEVAARIRCKKCGKKRLRGYTVPAKAEMGSAAPIDVLIREIMELRPGRHID